MKVHKQNISNRNHKQISNDFSARQRTKISPLNDNVLLLLYIYFNCFCKNLCIFLYHIGCPFTYAQVFSYSKQYLQPYSLCLNL